MPNDIPSLPAAQTAFHQRIRANTEATVAFAAAVAKIAQDVEPRVAAIEKVDLPHLKDRVLTLEKLPHEIKELGHKVNRRIDDKAQALQQQLNKQIADTMRAIQDTAAAPTLRHGILYAVATNSDGSFDGRTALGRLFLDYPVGRKALNGISDIAALPRPKRTQFIETMRDAYSQLRPDQQEHIGPLSDGDWGRLFDCAPELARAFAAAHPPPPALAI